MRRFLAAWAALALIVAVPALAIEMAPTDEVSTGVGGGFGGRSNDCPAPVVWDVGMEDNFTPPTGVSSSASAGCFINAINDGGFPADGRRAADDWIADGRPITHVKIWGRFNQQGYDYYVANPGTIHGFCVKFYKPRADQQPVWCPDGTVEGEDAIGDIVYEQYVPWSAVTEYGPLPAPAPPRNYNYCMVLPAAFFNESGQVYWLSVSADFDFTSYGGGVTQWFWRLWGGGIGYYPYCEAAWWNNWSSPPVNWNAISVGVSQPGWAGWEMSFVLYSDYSWPVKACCVGENCQLVTEPECQELGGVFHPEWDSCGPPNPCLTPHVCCIGQECLVITEDECGALGGVFHPEWDSCGPPNPCEATPANHNTWGGVKNMYR
jgi:hypothetical protein